MIISYEWLLNYLPEALPVAELSKILTSIGLEVEAVETVEAVKGSLEGLVIGHVLTCEKHPNADKLSVTTVDVGTGTPLNIVCGAPNVAAGQKVVVATVGTTVHPTEGDPFLIKKAKIRGAESEGMICAEDEIGLGKSHAGIMILPEDAVVGTPAKKYFNIPDADFAIHIGLTPNRSDAMSHTGVARDICAYLTHHRSAAYKPVLPAVSLPASDNSMQVKVTVEATEACPRYTGICISNVTVGPSPEWLQQRLKAIDLRPINNIVDITNFVLHEYGQPLHAFDAAQIKGSEIHVRFLPEGSKFVTLDEKERTLQGNDLMICDAIEGMCIAGVFGGLHSGITEGTKQVFLESAYFHPTFIRRTSLHHGLRTDAATHFEKGVDINNVIPALERAAALIVEIAGGTIASAVTDVYPAPVAQAQVTFTCEYIRRICGKDYAAATIKEILEALNFVFLKEEGETFTVQVPSNKTDVLQPADIAEEVLRIDGLDNVAIPGRLNIALAKALPNDREQREKLAELLCGSGFQEIVTNSIVNSKFYPDRTDLVRMLNSLSSELDVMRPSMLESGLEVVQYNVNRKSQDLALFEFGKTYVQPEQGKYQEDVQLALWVTGNAVKAQWNQKAAAADIYYLKGILQNLMQVSGIKSVQLSYEEQDGNLTAIWKWKNQVLCTAAQIPGQKLAQFDIKQDVCFAAINWQLWLNALASNKIVYTEVPKFPAVQRDLAIILDKAVSYQDVKKVTEQQKIAFMQSFDLFDVFESEKLGADKKSYALSYTFQLQDRTLTDAEIEQVMKDLMQAYKTKLQAQIRE
ncbi:phenylalanine--tRNA ligase subunit beta [Chitinophagaceae bacterium MMS25-I14]